MPRMFKFLLLLIIFSLMGPFVNAGTQIREYKVAYINNFFPFQGEYDKKADGFVIDLLEGIALEEKINFIYFPTHLEEAFSMLEKGEVDAIAGLKYTARLDEGYDFSNPFTIVSHSLVVPYEEKHINSIADLGQRVVAVERMDEGLNIMRDVRGAKFITASTQGNAFNLLELGRADAFLGNTSFIKAYIKQYNLEDKYKIIDNLIAPSDYALATKEGNRELLKKVNNGLIKIRAKQKYQEVYNDWFGWENTLLVKRFRILLIVFLSSLFLISIYVLLSINWNKKLKQEVYNRTIELEKANQLLKEKIVEEERLRNKLVYKEKMQTLGQLIAGIAHELRNPLTSIKAFVELIPFKYENERFRKEISAYLPSEINRLNKLVNNLLDYAKPQLPKKISFNLKEALGSILGIFNAQLKNKNIMIVNNTKDSHFVYADYGQIKQVIINLLLNAMEAIEGKGEVIISSYGDGNDIIITIEDNGIGMTEDEKKMIFEPFYTNKKNGTGLGLSLSLQYIDENDGDIRIESKPGKGTKVIITLPEGDF